VRVNPGLELLGENWFRNWLVFITSYRISVWPWSSKQVENQYLWIVILEIRFL